MQSFKEVKMGFYLGLIILQLLSCKPAIRSFTAIPPVITDSQKVILQWDVRGKEVLEFNRHKTVDSTDVLQFTLIVKRGVGEARKSLEVLKFRLIDTINIIIATNSRYQNQVAATGDDILKRFSDFEVISIASAMERDLLVIHDGRQDNIKPGDGPSFNFTGTSVRGFWKLQTKLSQQELLDSSIIPGHLSIKALIKQKKR